MGNNFAKFNNAEIAIKDNKITQIDIKIDGWIYFQMKFHDNGNIKTIANQSKDQYGITIHFNEDGTLNRHYQVDKDRLVTGVCVKYQKGVAREIGFQKNNKWDGFCTDYNEEGIKTKEGIYVDSKANGKFKTFYPDGTVKESGIQKDGKWNGFAIDYRNDGTKLQEANYIDGKANGKLITYHADGINVEYETYDVDGVRHGERKRFDKFGNVVEYYLYDNGKIMKYWPPSLKIDEKDVDIDKLKEKFDENVNKFESALKYVPIEGSVYPAISPLQSASAPQNTASAPSLRKVQPTNEESLKISTQTSTVTPSAPIKTPEMILAEVLKSFAKIPTINNPETVKPVKEVILLD